MPCVMKVDDKRSRLRHGRDDDDDDIIEER